MPKERKITLAKYAGFCYGVKRAVESVRHLKTENPHKNICILGELIHNAQVIKELASDGIQTINTLPDRGKGICVVRTHGESTETFTNIRNAGLEPYDMTCPDVKKVQQKAIELVKAGYFLVIVGKCEHPEVKAISANALCYSPKVFVATKVEELKKIETELRDNKKIGVVVQTTQMLSTLNPIVEYLISISKELLISNTICPSTSRRQSEACELAKENDLMIVVGSKNSANTTHLAELTKKITETIHIETAQELNQYINIINKSVTIGITAGASTPQCVIDEVYEELFKI